MQRAQPGEALVRVQGLQCILGGCYLRIKHIVHRENALAGWCFINPQMPLRIRSIASAARFSAWACASAWLMSDHPQRFTVTCLPGDFD
jgi:hypothetical protein